MRLATFLTPDGTERAGEVRGDTVVAFAGGSVRDRLASGETTPADGDEYALADVTLLAPVAAPPGDLRDRPQLRQARCGDRQGAARAADGVHEAADLERARQRHRRGARGRRPPARLRGRARRGDRRRRGDRAATRSPTTSPPATSRAARRSGRAPRASTARAPGAPGSRPPTRSPTPPALRIGSTVNGEVRQDSNTADLIFGPQALVDFLAEAITLEPGDIVLTGTPEGVGRRWTHRASWKPETSCGSRWRAWARSSTRSRSRALVL